MWQTTGQGHPTCFKFRCWFPVLCDDDVQRKRGKKNEDSFVRQVNAAPYPMMCLTFDWTLHDLARFCTNPNNFSILGVDPTFNLGDFDVTVTTYHHLMLELKGSSCPKHPVLLGPLFVHVRKNFEAYHFFASTLVSKCPELRCIQCFGTDGEEALSKALSTVFPSAEHIRCFLHFRSNIESKLRSLHSQMSSWKNLLKIFLATQQL